MEFLKKHYEKVLLGLVLLGLTVAVALLPVLISGKRDNLKTEREKILNPKITELPPLDLAREEAAMQRARTPIRLVLSGKHNTLNPVLWQKTPDGRLVKIQTGTEMVEGVEPIAIRPLYLKLSFDSISGKGFLFGVERQAATRPADRSKRQTLATKENPKNDYFTLRDVKGTPENPTGFALELSDTGEMISVVPGQAYQRVDGYEADLKYGTEKTWLRQRVNSVISFSAGQYKIVAITQSNVVLSANSNDKKTTINFNPATEPR
jgi:hypothetical protein